MANLVYCRGCGKQLHETAVACPHCGAQQAHSPAPVPVSVPVASPMLSNVNFWIALAAAVMGLISCLSLFGRPEYGWDRQTYSGLISFALAALIAGGGSYYYARGVPRWLALVALISAVIGLIRCISQWL